MEVNALVTVRLLPFLDRGQFFSFGCLSEAVAGRGKILGLDSVRLGLLEDVWVEGLVRGHPAATISGLGVLAF